MDLCQEPIYANIYDLSQINNFLRPFGIGTYHIGIEIYGSEYSFNDQGIFSISPKSNELYPLRETIYLGTTNLNYYQIYNIITNLKTQFNDYNYDIYTHNCNDFCDKLLSQLTQSKLPDHICRLNNISSFFSNIFKNKVLEDNELNFNDIESGELIEIKVE